MVDFNDLAYYVQVYIQLEFLTSDAKLVLRGRLSSCRSGRTAQTRPDGAGKDYWAVGGMYLHRLVLDNFPEDINRLIGLQS